MVEAPPGDVPGVTDGEEGADAVAGGDGDLAVMVTGLGGPAAGVKLAAVRANGTKVS